jgi:ubiquinone/menaquinone biosynthesis C-methylase UbiE
MNNLNIKDIESMSYTDFISLIKETNRCPGGKDTIRRMAQNAFIDKNSKVLEIGSNTGFTSLEIAHLIKCNVEGIDVSESCVAESMIKLKTDTRDVQNLVNFQVGSAYDIPFDDESFDLVVTGGATSFMDKKEKAISEYIRVTKPWGFISATQLFYETVPPQDVLDDVSNALGVKINPWGEKDWLKVFEENNFGLEKYYFYKGALNSRDEKDIKEYVDYFMNKEHLVNLSHELRDVIRNKWIKYIDIFNENHKYLGYFTVLFRKTKYDEEPELFTRR